MRRLCVPHAACFMHAPICKLPGLKYVVIIVIMGNNGIIMETENVLIRNNGCIITHFGICNNDIVMT